MAQDPPFGPHARGPPLVGTGPRHFACRGLPRLPRAPPGGTRIAFPPHPCRLGPQHRAARHTGTYPRTGPFCPHNAGESRPPPPLVLCHTPAKPPDRDATTDSRLGNTTVRPNPAPAGNPSATSKGSCQGYTAPTGEVIMPTGVPGPCCRRLAGAEPRDRSADRRQRRPTIAAAGHSREHNDSGYSGAQQRSTDLPCGSGVTRGSQVQEPARPAGPE